MKYKTLHIYHLIKGPDLQRAFWTQSLIIYWHSHYAEILLGYVNYLRWSFYYLLYRFLISHFLQDKVTCRNFLEKGHYPPFLSVPYPFSLRNLAMLYFLNFLHLCILCLWHYIHLALPDHSIIQCSWLFSLHATILPNFCSNFSLSYLLTLFCVSF